MSMETTSLEQLYLELTTPRTVGDGADPSPGRPM
jgi:hypothetical protein